MNDLIRHSFIGIGKMALVLLENLLQQSENPKNIIVSRRSLPALKKIQKKYRVAVTTDNREAASQVRYLWLGIKPQQSLQVLREIQPFLSRSTIVLSMMAGVTTKTIQKILGRSWPVIRLMPNTPAKLGKGATGLYFSKEVPQKVKKEITQLLAKLGAVFPLKREVDFHGLTGLSGSGPAYIYEVAEGLIAGGVRAGLTRKQSRQLAVATLQGAAAMLETSELSPESLIAHVTSKKGTTEAGMKVLRRYRISKALERAVAEAAKRSEQISKSLEPRKTRKP